MKLPTFFTTIALLIAAMPSLTLGQSSVRGVISDKSSKEKLVGVNIMIVGTSLGAASDLEGQYRISGISQAMHRIKVSCVGYEPQILEIDFRQTKDGVANFQLTPSIIQGDEVVVTALLRGQLAAINQQLTSNSIANVVSQDLIRELPDQNAAEAISRLPGISVQRSGGEAQKIVIRGLAPKFNNITINGEKIPSTDLEDRSVDLSSISSDMLAGIEVYKSPTADKDGDAVGGTINFSMKRAPEFSTLEVRLQGGRNSLEKDYGDYKGSLNVSDRYFNSAVGIILTGSIQKANRSSDGQQEEYALSSEPVDGSPIPYKINDMRLVDRKETRKRYGASMMLDYDFADQNALFLTGFWSRTNRDESRQRKRFNIQESRMEFDYQGHQIGTQLFSLALNGDHTINLPFIGGLDVNWRASTSLSDQNNPDEIYGRFFQMGLPGVVGDQGPENVPASVAMDPDNTFLKQIIFASERVTDKNQAFQADAKSHFNWGSGLSGYLKFGTRYSAKSRERNRTQIISKTTIENDFGQAVHNNPTAFYRAFPLTSDVSHKVLMAGFTSNDDGIGEFLGGKYSTWPTLNGSLIREFWDQLRYWTTPAGLTLFDNNQAETELQYGGNANVSYTAEEKMFAGYMMSEINIGDNIMILPGLRYEGTRNIYKSAFGTNGTISDDTPNLAVVKDSTGESMHENWLPMIQTRVSLFEGASVRASVARTLSRPNYFDIVPYEIIDRSGSPRSIMKGNPSLNYTTAINYDLYLSLFNRYGLFAVGGFYKALDNISYLRTSYLFSGPYKGFRLTQPVNATAQSYVYGGEIEVQTNLTLLPRPFNGIVLSGNLAIMKSRTIYPRFLVTNKIVPIPPFLTVSVLDTVREAPMPGQADYMGNLSIGYEYEGFSGRVSLIFQGKSLAVVGTREEMDGYTNSYSRWDAAVKQKISNNISLFLNVNNITGSGEVSSNQRFLTSEQYYGWSVELGMRYKL